MDDLPPPYSAGPSTPSSVPVSSLPVLSQSSSSSLFTHHLSSLRSQIANEQAARASARDLSDARLLALLVPCVEDLLASIAAVHPPPRLVESALVPAAAVGPDWHFSDQDERRDGELRSVVRVEPEVKGDSKRPADEGTMWWDDEDTARRLAKFLCPEGPVPNLERLAVRAHVKEAKKASRWGVFKRDAPQPSTLPPRQAAPTKSPTAEEDISMVVEADEVTFRRENEMGIWESRTGWGILVRVRLPPRTR
ncbi:NAD-dependent epimerase/dehydratase family protein [Purpureocillium lavendulum]|uniref:NAD-dependent epimerase/dehydratase family protein n=1 Tax=Purpureocillium lavendulum TaxID=1247861 RepID=A0AB34FLK9_9HYPO|nr:NAD-dependent epimerase/dehydratase family protein [Purpureocillium lavendulum]